LRANNKISRRNALQAAMGTVTTLSLGMPAFLLSRAHAQSPARAVSTLPLSNDLHVLSAGGVNAVALTGVEGAVLVDGGAAQDSPALLEAVSGLPGGGPVHTLFNTHWHHEHTGSNEPLGRAGATIIAHANTRLWLTTDVTWPWDGSRFERLPEVARPNRIFYDRDELRVGRRDIAYGYVRHCPHTDGDMYVFFADDNVLVVGDAVSGDGWPLIDWWTGGWIGGIVGGLQLLLSLSDAGTRIVPARGPVLSRADLESMYEMYRVIFERLARLLNTGRGPEEAVAARPTEEFDARMGHSDEFVRRAFESMWGYLSPDA
jgi:cyclase